ncbi:MAG: prolyl oligopeptidase family serine peptidase [Acidimicrobiia bacterium]|nr:prolyl oligopeptidase family serine peptidase [Acidimicrobiia bacterium]
MRRHRRRWRGGDRDHRALDDGVRGHGTVDHARASRRRPSPPAAGCGERVDGAVAVGGGRRAVVRSPVPASPAPAVVALHGWTGDPSSIEATSGWTPFLAERGAIAVYPEGTATGVGGYAWSAGRGRYSTEGVDDVAYLADLLDLMVAQLCVDPERIALVGASNGGAMVVRAACDPRVGDRVALAGAVIPAVGEGAIEGCARGPSPLVAIAGRRDASIDYEGDGEMLGQEAWFRAVAAARNGCAEVTPSRTAIEGGERIVPEGCEALTELIALDEGVHTWPGGPTGTGGLDPGDFDATAHLWERAGFGG